MSGRRIRDRRDDVGVIEWGDVQIEQRRWGGNEGRGDERRIRDIDMGNDTRWECRQGKQRGEGQRADDRIDKHDGDREDDWECGIDDEMSGRRIGDTSKHVGVDIGGGVSTRMGRIVAGGDGVDGRDGPDAWRKREQQHVGDV